MAKLADNRWFVPLTLSAILLVAAYVRIVHLGDEAFRTDEGTFWNVCHQTKSGFEIFHRWLDFHGGSSGGHFPLSLAVTKWFLDLLHLPMTYFTVRLPSTLWGVATVFIAYCVGREFSRWAFGLAFALILAFNPYHIQISRDAYFYPPLVCGSCLGLWSVLWMFHHIRMGKPLTPWFYLLNASGFFLLTYSQVTGWPLALLFGLTILYGVGRDYWRSRLCWRPLLVVISTFLVFGIPLLLVPWALHDILHASSEEERTQMVRIFGQGGPFLHYIARCITSYAWGSTPLRAFFTVAMLCLGISPLLQKSEPRKQLLLVWGYMLAGFAFLMFSLHTAGRPYATRYIVVLMPFYLLVLTSGIMVSAQSFPFLPKNYKGYYKYIPAILLTIAIVLWCEPVYLCTRITSTATPYKKIISWLDGNLPPGTLVLVDRWLEPWNELRTEPATNVIFTYTVPNEPADVFLQTRWRDTATNFFAQNPDAGYLEIARVYWEVPGIGPWKWPREFFVHHVAFTNEPGMRLRALGEANREMFYGSNTNRLIADFFYDTRNDALKKAKEAGRKFVAFYGPGWGYWKNGQGWNYAPRMDYQEWRVLQDSAQLDLYNLTDQPAHALVTILGASTPSAKEVEVENQARLRFAGNRLEQARLGPLLLPPGHTPLSLRDEHWAAAKVTLLVRSVALEPAATASESR
jgi:4-amino-4-deoxy-L-arabinose transferase-like glycosyltransferase